jgi:hypothetical protein
VWDVVGRAEGGGKEDEVRLRLGGVDVRLQVWGERRWTRPKRAKLEGRKGRLSLQRNTLKGSYCQ